MRNEIEIMNTEPKHIFTRVKKKFVVVSLTVAKPEKFIPIEVRLPANVKRITGILVTASAAWTRLEP